MAIAVKINFDDVYVVSTASSEMKSAVLKQSLQTEVRKS